MLLKKEGLPEEDELVLCTVTKIHHHSVFALLDEYGKTGMIHISEVSPGRIRNLRDYVKEDKKIICKVLRIDPEKGHIDLSLRRVNELQRRAKLDSIKKEQLAENIISLVAKNKKKDVKKSYSEIAKPILKEYEDVYSAFLDVVTEETTLEELGVPTDIAKELLPLILQRIHPPEVVIGGNFAIRSYEPDGVELIRKAFAKAREVEGKHKMKYCGGGNYEVSVTADDYKEAEGVLGEIRETVTSFLDNRAEVSFERSAQ